MVITDTFMIREAIHWNIQQLFNVLTGEVDRERERDMSRVKVVLGVQKVIV